jgi:hypothetical protein
MACRKVPLKTTKAAGGIITTDKNYIYCKEEIYRG